MNTAVSAEHRVDHRQSLQRLRLQLWLFAWPVALCAFAIVERLAPPVAPTATAGALCLIGAFSLRRRLLRAPDATSPLSSKRTRRETRATLRLVSIWLLICLAAWCGAAAVRGAGIGTILIVALLPAAMLATTPPKLLVDLERP